MLEEISHAQLEISGASLRFYRLETVIRMSVCRLFQRQPLGALAADAPLRAITQYLREAGTTTRPGAPVLRRCGCTGCSCERPIRSFGSPPSTRTICPLTLFETRRCLRRHDRSSGATTERWRRPASLSSTRREKLRRLVAWKLFSEVIPLPQLAFELLEPSKLFVVLDALDADV